MRLRGRTVGDAEDDAPAVASTSSNSMDENSSTGAVLGSPVARRSLSTTHDSQESLLNPAPVAASFAHSNPYYQQPYESGSRTSRGQYPYLTDYEITTHPNYEEYPTTISDSQDLYSASPPRTHHSEEPQAYVQTSLSPATTHDPPYSNTNVQTPTQSLPHYPGYQTPSYSPFSQTPTQPLFQPPSYPSLHQTPISEPPSRYLNCGQPSQEMSSINDERYTHFHPPSTPTLAGLSAPFPFVQSNQPHDFSEQPFYQQNLGSDPLNRYFTFNNEEAWSPAAQPNPGSHKRRISEADETVDGFRSNKLRTELDEIEARGEGSNGQPPRKKKRWRRGRASGKKRGKGRSRSRSRSKDRNGGKGRGHEGSGENGGNNEGIIS